MREIKFRGKMPNGAWVYGSFWNHPVYPDIIEDYATHRLVDRDTVGQFTGLKDKDGKEVYEGDILANSHDVRVIEWRDYQWSMVSHTHPFQATVPMIWIGGYKVVGNIYDNPGLLERRS